MIRENILINLKLCVLTVTRHFFIYIYRIRLQLAFDLFYQILQFAVEHFFVYHDRHGIDARRQVFDRQIVILNDTGKFPDVSLFIGYMAFIQPGAGPRRRARRGRGLHNHRELRRIGLGAGKGPHRGIGRGHELELLYRWILPR